MLLIMKLNMARNTSIQHELPQLYEAKLVERFEAGRHSNPNPPGDAGAKALVEPECGTFRFKRPLLPDNNGRISEK